jgi:NADH-quinone oxidoreductase subunit C
MIVNSELLMDTKNLLLELIKDHGELIITPQQEFQFQVSHEHYYTVAQALRDHPEIPFEQLIDLTIVDLLTFGQSQWRTNDATAQGFSRAVIEENFEQAQKVNRFVLVAHFLSYKKNVRVRLKSFIPPTLEMMTLSGLWSNANWYERECFDLFGIIFNEHKDLRRILTDYGFVGHPFRKDFPVIGCVELRYDQAAQQCLYEQNSIENRTLVPKVIIEN